MISKAKAVFYLVEFINAYAAVYYANFLFFYLKRDFGFGGVENLLTAAFGGGLYILAAWRGGKYAERRGCIPALYRGLSLVILSLLAGLVLPLAAAQVLVYGGWTVGICFTWPALEALISERAGRRLADCVGLYNVAWAGGGAVGYFTTGLLIEALGMPSLFWLPVLLSVTEIILVAYGSSLRLKERSVERVEVGDAASVSLIARPKENRLFLHLAWFANPFSYVAINTVIPLIPTLAETVGLSTAQAGIICSFWMFARLITFAILWRWTQWHYSFTWLAVAFFVMIAAFFGFLTASSLPLLIISEICFGASIGLIYYSSLYYAMNVSQGRSTNAGIHEAAIGAGLFMGPAMGALALTLSPATAGIGAWAVGGLLCTGFMGLFWIKKRIR
jgi:MFS family permease